MSVDSLFMTCSTHYGCVLDSALNLRVSNRTQHNILFLPIDPSSLIAAEIIGTRWTIDRDKDTEILFSLLERNLKSIKDRIETMEDYLGGGQILMAQESRSHDSRSK